jgi:hypothetical protein
LSFVTFYDLFNFFPEEIDDQAKNLKKRDVLEKKIKCQRQRLLCREIQKSCILIQAFGNPARIHGGED